MHIKFKLIYFEPCASAPNVCGSSLYAMLHSVSPIMDAWGCSISYLVASGYTHISAQIDVCMIFWLMMNLGYYTSVNNNQTFFLNATMPPCSGAIFFYIMQVLGLNPENAKSNNFQTLLGQFLLGFWCLMYFVYATFSFFFFNMGKKLLLESVVITIISQEYWTHIVMAVL